MPSTSQNSLHNSPHIWNILGVINLAVPFAIAVAICLRTAINIPYTDDYDAIGLSMASYARANGWDRIMMILTAQHVQYKLMFLRTIVALQYHLTGHIDYKVLQYIGDLAAFAVVIILWLLLARSGRSFTQRLWLFTVPCYLYLSLRYFETINWAMSGLQNLAVIPFALATLLFITSNVRFAFAWSMIFLVISIATSGNGFFVALIVLGHLAWSRRFRDVIVALAVVTAMALLYAYHYIVYTVAPPLPLHEAITTIAQFPFLFLGSLCHRPAAALPVGIAVVVGFLWLTWRGWYRADPGSFLSASFCVVTALAVTATRYRGHIPAALSNRYVMYSLLLISLEFIGLLRLEVPVQLRLRSRWGISLLLVGAASILLCLYSQAVAYGQLNLRKQELITHLILWERHPDRLVLSPDEDPLYRQPDWITLRTRFQVEMTDDIALGIYTPPYSADDPLPIRTHSPATIGIEDERR